MQIFRINSDIADCLKKIAYRNKYDLLANSLSKEIFQKLILNQEFSFDIQTENNITIKIRAGKDTDREKTANEPYDNFTIKSNSTLVDNTTEIFIYFRFKYFFSKKDYESFIYILYEIIRHEIEHAYQFSIGKQPDESYKTLYDKLFQGFPQNIEDFSQHVNTISQYLTSNEEIDAYAKSIVYIAKKRKVPFNQIIKQIFNRAFFNNKIEIAQLANQNLNIIEEIEATRQKLITHINKLYPSMTLKTTFL